MKEFEPAKLIPLKAARQFLKYCGVGVKLYAGCRLVPGDRISIGECSQIDEGVRIFAGKGVRIGSHVHIAFAASISGGGECEIHDFVGVGAGVRILTGTEKIDGEGLTNPTVPPHLRSVHRGRVQIGAHAIIFTNSIIFPDVVIGEGAVVAAGSTVHRNLQPWTVYAGHPLVPIRTRRTREPTIESRHLPLSSLPEPMRMIS